MRSYCLKHDPLATWQRNPTGHCVSYLQSDGDGIFGPYEFDRGGSYVGVPYWFTDWAHVPDDEKFAFTHVQPQGHEWSPLHARGCSRRACGVYVGAGCCVYTGWGCAAAPAATPPAIRETAAWSVRRLPSRTLPWQPIARTPRSTIRMGWPSSLPAPAVDGPGGACLCFHDLKEHDESGVRARPVRPDEALPCALRPLPTGAHFRGVWLAQQRLDLVSPHPSRKLSGPRLERRLGHGRRHRQQQRQRRHRHVSHGAMVRHDSRPAQGPAANEAMRKPRSVPCETFRQETQEVVNS